MTVLANSFDTAVREWMIAHQTPAGLQIAAFVSHVGSVNPMRWIAVLASVLLLARRRVRAAFSLVIAPFLALAAHTAAMRLLPRERPLGAAGYHEASSSFPSAHATTSSAVCCTLAYILWREQLLAAPVALAVAIVPPLCIGLSRLYLDVHWATDVIGGWCVGLAVLGVAAGVYRLWPSNTES